MPATAVGILVALLLAPGFLLVRGYERRRYRTRPERDIYAVAEAVVASAIWLGILWLVLTKVLGNPIKHVGLFPLDRRRLDRYPGEVVALGLVAIVMPYGIGVVAALLGDRVATAKRQPLSSLRWAAHQLGFFKIPNAWDRAWAEVERRGAAHVVIQLKDGTFVVGGYGEHSRIDTSPLTTRTVFLPHAHARASTAFQSGVGMLLNLDENRDELLKDPGFEPMTEEVSMMVDGDDIAAVFFRKD